MLKFLHLRNNYAADALLGTPEGFEAVYRAYVGKMLRIAFNQLRDEEVAKDLVHGIFCRLWERRDTLQLNGTVEHYLVRAVKLTVLDHIRVELNRTRLLASALDDYRETDDYTEKEINYAELSFRVDRLVDQLPNQCQEVYRLSREKGLTNKEIASILSVAEKTVEAHLTKALKFLRTSLADYPYSKAL